MEFGTARCTPPTAPAFQVSRFFGSRWRRVAGQTGVLYMHCQEQARVFLGPAASGLAAATPLLSHATPTAHALRLPLSHTDPTCDRRADQPRHPYMQAQEQD